jgi:hypothetical protein
MIEQWNAGAARPPEIGFVWRICPSRERRSPDRHRGQGLGSFVQPAPGPAARLGLFGTIGPLGPPADHRIGFVWRDRPASVARLAGHRLGAPLRAIGFVWRVSLLGTRGRLPGLALFGRIGLRAPPGLPQIGFVWHSRSLSATMQRQIGFVWHNRPLVGTEPGIGFVRTTGGPRPFPATGDKLGSFGAICPPGSADLRIGMMAEIGFVCTTHLVPQASPDHRRLGLFDAIALRRLEAAGLSPIRNSSAPCLHASCFRFPIINRNSSTCHSRGGGNHKSHCPSI